MRLIDAEKLKKILRERICDNGFCSEKTYWLIENTVMFWIDKAPTVDPVKHGEWMHKENSPWNFFVCSVCGAEHIATFGKEDNYCSCCGAKMDGDKNG